MVVLNHELSIYDTLNAFVDQKCFECGVWDSENKEYVGILSINEILEIFMFFID